MDSITFSEATPTGHGIDVWQDILSDGKVIGFLETRTRGMLAPLDESYQFSIDCPESELQDYSYGESETKGWFIVYFDTLEDFLAGVKHFG